MYEAELEIVAIKMESMFNQIVADLPKAVKMTAASRRVRVLSCELEKVLRQFRKISCLAGLK
jgi:hypothetical protein